MRLMESIKISPTSVLQESVPEEVTDALHDIEQRFDEVGNSLVWHSSHVPGLFDHITERLSERSSLFNLYHALWPEYEESDYTTAPFWFLVFPEEWVDEIDFQVTCQSCGTKLTKIDTSVQVAQLSMTRHPIVSINGQFLIIDGKLRKQIENELHGVSFKPFDRKESYFYVLPTHKLSPLILPENEVIGYEGLCDSCGSPIFEMHFGPLRYPYPVESKLDVVGTAFYDRIAFSPHAAEVLSANGVNFERDGIVLLE